MKRMNYSSDTPWEDKFGYSRAVRVGNIVHVSGTTGTDKNGMVCSSDPYEQTKYALIKIQTVLNQAGSNMNDVYRVRIFVNNIDRHAEVMEAYTEFFKTIKPTATLLEASGFIDPEICVEIEAEAFVS